MDILLTAHDASRVLGLAAQTLARWRVEGVGPYHVRVGNRVRYRRADLDAFIDARVRRSTSESSAV